MAEWERLRRFEIYALCGHTFAMTWIALIDESGDHGLENIDPASPMFALTAAVYRQDTYLNKDLPAIAAMKHRFWSHEGAILRSYDINKKQGFFSFCVDPAERQKLYDAISELFHGSSAKLIAAVIDKERHKAQYHSPEDTYRLAIQFVLERIFMMTGKGTKIIFESRGRTEDKIVGGWCGEISGGGNYGGRQMECTSYFAKKSWNVAGLQMADLACQPIIHHVQNPDSKRPDWAAVRPRMRSSLMGKIEGYGLKVFPQKS